MTEAENPAAPQARPSWLDRILAPDAPSFALLHRPGSPGRGPDPAGRIELLLGTTQEVERIADIPLGPGPGVPGRPEVLALLPYRQIAERGFQAPDDGAPLLAMSVLEHRELPLEEVRAALPSGPVDLWAGGFDADDRQYAATVRKVLAEEIGTGTGANFVIKRSFVVDIVNWSPATALAVFRRLLGRDPGAYWTFLVHTGKRTFIGASPERHVSLDRGTVVMNPISGTYRYPPAGPDLAGVLEFLADGKEADELSMVLDEELKMTGRVCGLGGRVVGPNLVQMARIAHTEYLIEGRSTLDVRDILRETMFAPTVTGGPIESACRVINRFEPEGRGYYSGVVALLGRDAAGGQALDSAIMIRTAEIQDTGRMRLSVGATLVRGSDPDSEAAETRAKAAGLLDALHGDGGHWNPHSGSHPGPDDGRRIPDPAARRLADHPEVRRALAARNEPLAGFWFEKPAERARLLPALTGRSVLVIDAEDTFTAMARHALGALGLEVTVRRYDERHRTGEYDLVILGPGPGDPRDLGDPKIARMTAVARELLASGAPFFAVCLGHQILSSVLGLELVANPVPYQGTQRRIELFGRSELVGFYNTFSARCDADYFVSPEREGLVEVVKDAASGEVHALRGPGFTSVQFHPASVLTRDGVRILGDILGPLADQLCAAPVRLASR